MAHFAELDKNNIVLRVIVVSNEMLLEDGQESEAKGAAFCKQLFGENTVWAQTSYNANIRKNYAGIGYAYRADIDAFVPPQPYPSWTLNVNAQWQPPVPYPNDEKKYVWDEPTTSWQLME
jgi:hypothetical protein